MSSKRVVKTHTRIYWFGGSFWGSFLSKKLVDCRSKTSLTCVPLQIVILASSGHPKRIKFEGIFWCKFDRFWRWWGQAVHKNQCFFFLRSWCYFSSSAVALLVGISKFKHIYEAELQLSTRFPFHCQDRFPGSVLWGFENEVKKNIEKVVPKGSKWTPKVVKNQ